MDELKKRGLMKGVEVEVEVGEEGEGEIGWKELGDEGGEEGVQMDEIVHYVVGLIPIDISGVGSDEHLDCVPAQQVVVVDGGPVLLSPQVDQTVEESGFVLYFPQVAEYTFQYEGFEVLAGLLAPDIGEDHSIELIGPFVARQLNRQDRPHHRLISQHLSVELPNAPYPVHPLPADEEGENVEDGLHLGVGRPAELVGVYQMQQEPAYLVSELISKFGLAYSGSQEVEQAGEAAKLILKLVEGVCFLKVEEPQHFLPPLLQPALVSSIYSSILISQPLPFLQKIAESQRFLREMQRAVGQTG